MLLIVVDSYSKWPKVVIQNSTTSEATVNALRTIFSRGGIPHTLVSDNGPQFKSHECKDLLDWECCTNLHRHIIQVLMGKQSDLCKL